VDKNAGTNTIVADLREVLGSVTPTYSITSGNTGNIFSIDATTGQIKVNNATALAADSATSYTLGISATLGGGGNPLTLTTQIAVQDASADTLEGGAGNDTLHGSAGNNVLDGGADNDVIYGLTGNDTLMGGTGQDTMTGGIGNDRFTFSSVADSSTATPDTITDFDANGDLLVLTGLLTGTFSFVGAHTNPFTGGGNASARFNDASNLLQLDSNGDAAVDFSLILTGVALPDLSIADFVL
jgi:Ca2+-binding RTX toxin-like protein